MSSFVLLLETQADLATAMYASLTASTTQKALLDAMADLLLDDDDSDLLYAAQPWIMSHFSLDLRFTRSDDVP